MYSVIVVCLNAGQRLRETIDSILRQSYKNFEVIVKDGGSSDGSVEMLQGTGLDERVHIYTQKDNGIYDAMNQAVKLAKGAYFLFLNTNNT